MQDPFSQVVDDSIVEQNDDALMTRATDSPMPPTSATREPSQSSSRSNGARQPLSPSEFASAAHTKLVCPFCGSINDRPASMNGEAPACPRCGMQDSSATRQATTSRIGPWFVRQSKNPSAPGMRFETLLALVKRGQISAGSIVRGPTTQQLWKFAGQVKGLSREFGLCYQCAGAIETTATICPACSRMQEPPVNPDVLLESPPTTPSKPQPPKPVAPATQGGPQPAVRPQQTPPPQAPASQAKSPMPAISELPGQRSPGAKVRRGEEILTARELAAAFQLDFQPADQRSSRGWNKPRRIKRKVALVAFLLVAGLVAAALVKRPDWRDQAVAWSSESYASVKQLVASASGEGAAKTKSTPTPETKSPDATPGRPPVSIESVPPANGNVTEAAPVPEDSATAAVAQAPASDVPPAPAIAPTPPEPLTGATKAAMTDNPAAALTEVPNPNFTAPTQSPRPTDPVSTNPAATGATSPTSLAGADQLEQARTLYRQAVDAERKRPADYAEAVRLYERVKRLPREVWPGDLEIRLNYARRAAAK